MNAANELPRILFVEDNPDDALLARTAIARSGRNVSLEFAENGRDALALLLPPSPLPDITFLDINLPLVSGLDVLRAVREHVTEPAPVIIVMTTSPAPDERDRAIAYGCTEFHVKPISFSEFMRTIVSVLDRWLHPRQGGH